jgi:uncharacterized membrane protein
MNPAWNRGSTVPTNEPLPISEVSVVTTGLARKSPFWRAVSHGLGVLLPPLLTIVIFLWMGSTIENYALEPVISLAERIVRFAIADIRREEAIPPAERGKQNPVVDGIAYHRLENGEYVPQAVYDLVKFHPGEEGIPRTASQVYRIYIRSAYLHPYAVIPAFVLIFTLLLYLLGKFMAAGIGRFFVSLIEGAIERVPVVRNVYSSVKQVSGFLLNERPLQVSRVVAVEYPRKGIWQIGFVTGEGLGDIEAMVGEQCLSVLVCTSPMPMTGFTVIVRRSECLDLHMTLDQAIQFIVSCGVVIPRPVTQQAVPPGASPQLEPQIRPAAGLPQASPVPPVGSPLRGDKINPATL